MNSYFITNPEGNWHNLLLADQMQTKSLENLQKFVFTQSNYFYFLYTFVWLIITNIQIYSWNSYLNIARVMDWIFYFRLHLTLICSGGRKSTNQFKIVGILDPWSQTLFLRNRDIFCEDHIYDYFIIIALNLLENLL